MGQQNKMIKKDKTFDRKHDIHLQCEYTWLRPISVLK